MIFTVRSNPNHSVNYRRAEAHSPQRRRPKEPDPRAGRGALLPRRTCPSEGPAVSPRTREEIPSWKVEADNSGEETGAHPSLTTVAENYPPLRLKLSNSLKDNNNKKTKFEH